MATGWDTDRVTDLILDSLQRRMRALHSLYYDAVDTMTIDHVNHFEREGVVPIAFCLFHITNMVEVEEVHLDDVEAPDAGADDAEVSDTETVDEADAEETEGTETD